MRIIFTGLILFVVVLIVLGFYLGWFHISSTHTGNQSQVTMTVDQGKIQADKNKVLNDVHNLQPPTTEPATHSVNNSTTEP